MNKHKKIITQLTIIKTHSGIYLNKLAMVCCLLLLNGCASHFKSFNDEPDINIPENWQAQEVQASFKSHNWLADLNDDTLNEYVAIALKQNYNLKASAARLSASFNQIKINTATLLPSASLNVNRNRSKNFINDQEIRDNTYSGSFDIRWEADVWGKLNQRRKFALFSAKAQKANYVAARLSLATNVAKAWYNLNSAKLLLNVANLRLASFKKTAQIIEDNYKSGTLTALDVYLSRTDVETEVSNLADAEFVYIQNIRTFKRLLAEYPTVDNDLDAQLPIIEKHVPAGLPSELLTRRPDIIASRASWQADLSSAKSAHRARFPSFSLTGSISDNQANASDLFDSDNLIWNIIGGISQPIFNAGSLKAQQQQAYYTSEASFANYADTILNAYQEVENALSREHILKKQHAALIKAVDLADGGFNLALDQYQSGIVNYTTVLEAQRRVFNTLSNEIRLRNNLLQNRLDLHLALGGDFSVDENAQKTEGQSTK